MDEMHLPGAPSLFFLFYLLILLPWQALRSARRLRGMQQAMALPDRRRVWGGTMFIQGAILLVAWIAGSSFDYPFFRAEGLTLQGAGAAAVALLFCLGLRVAVRRLRSEDERRKLMVYALAPRGLAEGVPWVATVLLASVAEEIAYRGVAVDILWYSLGSQAAAVGISALGFALAHSVQGLKSGALIFAIGLVMHALVIVTGTLVWAMLVHLSFDLIAGILIAREAARFDAEAAAAG